MEFMPRLVRSTADGGIPVITLGHPLLDDYLAFVAARGRTNTWLAVASDLKVFFTVVARPPAEVTAADVFGFLAAQRAPRHGSRVVRLEDGKKAARTITRRLSSVRGLYAYLCAREDTGVLRNPVPGSLAARLAGRAARPGRGAADPHAPGRCRGCWRPRRSTRCGRRCGPTATGPWSMRWCWAGCAAAKCSACAWGPQRRERRLFVAEGKGGRQRIVPGSARFFAAKGENPESERPAEPAARQLFVVLKGARRGEPLSAAGLDEILDGARARAGLDRATCHQLRHTCFTRLREAGMALEAIQAQAGHASIESTRLYVHLANDGREKEYLRAAEAIEAQVAPVTPAAVR